MDLVDGWNLAAILKRSRTADLPLPLALGLYITAELCRGVAYVHARKRPDGQPLAIVHRDINPQNVLISQDGEVKVTDFGIAKAIDRREHTFVGLIKGHPDFMSPEQASGGELDAASDIFSIGSVLYRLATGTAPFSSASDLETLLRVQAGKLVPPEGVAPDLPAAVITILKTAMQLDPSHRYRTAGDLMRALEEVLRSGHVTGRSELQRWLVELRDRDWELPTSEAPCLPADPEDPSAVATAVPPLSRRRRRVRARPRRTPVALAIVCGTIAVTAPPPGNQAGREANQPAIPDVSAAVQRPMPAAAATIQADMPATALAEELSHEEPERGEGALTSAAAADANGEVRRLRGNQTLIAVPQAVPLRNSVADVAGLTSVQSARRRLKTSPSRIIPGSTAASRRSGVPQSDQPESTMQTTRAPPLAGGRRGSNRPDRGNGRVGAATRTSAAPFGRFAREP